ncbi:MAG: hypothetical protein CM15mP59_0550 [Flavobacteriaceae bacterium]|nr:MAG: hypothetical protein CM15mP59_0550 [Flavobacteriaceae bacterium]
MALLEGLFLTLALQLTCVSTELRKHFHLNPKPSEKRLQARVANELDTEVAITMNCDWFVVFQAQIGCVV